MSTTVTPSIFDINNLTALKAAAKQDDPKALKAASQQFEALFLQMVLKSMRDANPREGMFDSEQTRMYESLLDQQLAQVMATKNGTGLAAVIERQLSRGSAEPVPFEDGLPLVPQPKSFPLQRNDRALPLGSTEPRPMPLEGVRQMPATGVAPTMQDAATGDPQAAATAREFANRVWPHAAEAARATGIPAHFLVAQAALETGWGRAEPRAADGRQSYNVFGIKAGRSWNGNVVEAATTEYVDGSPQRQTARFRAYGSYAEAFRDYANLLSSSPRYAAVLGNQDAAGFARGLQRAGYATDPMYADKLTRTIAGASLRNALTG